MRAATLILAAAVGSIALLVPGGEREAAPDKKPQVVLVIHGGAGVLTEAEMNEVKLESGERLERKHYEKALVEALSAGYRAWRQKKTTSVDVVEAAIRVMEDSELFNAGRGAALNHDGRAELDAAIMEGRMEGKGEGTRDPRKRAGAVAAVTHVRNPISAARAVLEMKDGRHVLLVGDGAEQFVLAEPMRTAYRIEKVSNAWFWTDRRLKQIRKALGKEEGQKGAGGGADRFFGTVGAVALKEGSLAAGTSTGGLTNKLSGRVGDSPIIGAGTYADDRACGVSCTGTGELFIRHAVAHDVVARMLYKPKCPVETAAQEAIDQLPDEPDGVGGLIALDRDGRHAFAMSARSGGMYRGYVTSDGEVHVAILAREELRRMKKLEQDGKRPGE